MIDMRLLKYQRVLESKDLETKHLPELQAQLCEIYVGWENLQQRASSYWAELSMISRDRVPSPRSSTSSSQFCRVVLSL